MDKKDKDLIHCDYWPEPTKTSIDPVWKCIKPVITYDTKLRGKIWQESL